MKNNIKYFGFINKKFISDELDMLTFNKLYPTIPIIDIMNSTDCLYHWEDGIYNLDFIVHSPPAKPKYNITSKYMLIEMSFDDKMALVEITHDCRKILNIYKLHNRDIIGTYYLTKDTTKIKGYYINNKDLAKYISNNYIPNKVLIYKKER